jgi:transcription initiation factor TFIIF subunit alpha
MSPAPASQPGLDTSQRRSSILKFNVPPSKLSEIQSAPPHPSPISGGPTSDGEVTEMSDGGTKKKIKLRLNQSSTTASRAGSPALGGGPVGNGGGNTGSRAGSPVAPGISMPSISLSSLHLFLHPSPKEEFLLSKVLF